MRARKRRVAIVIIFALVIGATAVVDLFRVHQANETIPQQTAVAEQSTSNAHESLQKLEIKGRAPKTGYSRDQFGEGWAELNGCDVRNLILQRDLTEIKLDEDGCKVLSGTLLDPYTNKTIAFTRGADTSDDVQIDHVVALSDAWQKGAQQLAAEQREAFANDSLNLQAVDGPTNQQKGDGDAATWLPPNKSYRCQYVARQIAVKVAYKLWVTQAEYDAMGRVLDTCPSQVLPLKG